MHCIQIRLCACIIMFYQIHPLTHNDNNVMYQLFYDMEL